MMCRHGFIATLVLLIILTHADFWPNRRAGYNPLMHKHTSKEIRFPSQEEASCPKPGCICNRTHVTCVNSRFRNSDVFQQIHERAFPHIDTLTMTGNNFGDISDGLFTEGEVHQSLSLMNLTGNGITKISSLTFKNTPTIQFLYLNNNNIKQAGRYPFESMRRLRLLDMTAALGRRPADSKADLISVLFETDKRGLLELVELKLAKNHIEKLHKDTFCKVLGLRRLDLSENNLTSFNVATNCLQSLEALDLSRNSFTTLSTTLWDSLESLNTLDISSNPLHCDCKLQPFVTLAKQEKYSFVNQGKTLCVSPSNRAGKSLFELREDLCKTSSWGFGTFILLVVVSAACLFAYRYYRIRTPKRTGSQFGYTGLDFEDDAVRPEFV